MRGPGRRRNFSFLYWANVGNGLIAILLVGGHHFELQVMRDEQDVVGILGLAGVVVNNSLVTIDFTDQKLRDSVPARTAIIEGASDLVLVHRPPAATKQ